MFNFLHKLINKKCFIFCFSNSRRDFPLSLSLITETLSCKQSTDSFLSLGVPAMTTNSELYVCMYIWGFRAHQYLRSLAPIMNDYGWLWWPDDIRGPWGLKLPDICLTGEEKPRKNLTQETYPDWGLNPGLLRDRHACYHLSHTVYCRCSRNL